MTECTTRYFRTADGPVRIGRIDLADSSADRLDAGGWTSAPSLLRIVYLGENLDWEELTRDEAALLADRLGLDLDAPPPAPAIRTPVRDVTASRPVPLARRFVREANQAQIEWKQTTSAIDEAARAVGSYKGREYNFCLPQQLAAQNLLPDARHAIEYFAAADIPWHDGVDGGPSTHLRDSQVQCVNALAPFMARPAELVELFGSGFVSGTPRPVGDAAAPDTFVAFEWIGDGDPLGEWKNGVGTRGAKNTSADAAIRHVEPGGREVLTLIEWKYSEQYYGAGELHTSSTSQATRYKRYRHLYENADGPLHTSLIPFDDFFVEPVYQLFRLSLLAWRLELAGVADCVRVAYRAPERNAALWASLNRESHRRACNDHLGELWQKMQRRPDRFILWDTARLVAPDAPTSAEFKARYGHIAGG